ncbi:helix-turn-helix domain-containing protein [Alkalihalobacillus sp. LMS39]|uniref:helix-turn-helix domain-containing protein n=1 Tax=Alkalihalobacillus sp. LMS39 TaxID=2924032 RepID=UPI001FB35959|nr:helix-turn-helix domain-containing protein [Alkalihalobacillus sp. LMS39]UOE93900.1 helix-turn-helix domain-containing protein [Alkalihalobacillus sp. LMS39]
MDCSKIGKLLFQLRQEKNMTQKEIADAIGISDKTISKWERGLGCPDVSLLGELSALLGVNIENILQGQLALNDKNQGNLKRILFYVCPSCGNTMTSSTQADIACCGRKLTSLTAKKEDPIHKIHVEEIEQDYFISIQHEMSKSHFLAFAAYVTCDKMLFIPFYPEQNAEFRVPKFSSGRLYVYCNQHGLWMKEIKKPSRLAKSS